MSEPLYSALDMAAKALKRKVGTGQEFMGELMKLPGVKPAEIQDRGLHGLMDAPKMTHEQFLGELAKNPVPKIQELEKGDRSMDRHYQEEAHGVSYDHPELDEDEIGRAHV